MANRVTKFIVILAFAAQPAVAQTLIPATSEDISEFDRQVSQQLQRQQSKGQKSNFGAQVNEEAKKLNEASGADSKKEFGKWVSGERKKADQGRPSSAGNSGAAAGSGSAARGNSAGKVPPDKGKRK